jgi:Putative auto-transporter adhesin, head GIN domain
MFWIRSDMLWIRSGILQETNMNYPVPRLKSMAAALLLASSVSLAPAALARGDESEMRDVADFDEVVVAGVALELSIEVGGEQSLEITVDEGDLERVETRVSNGVLTIRQRGRRWRGTDLEVHITMPALAAFTVEGAADAEIKGLDEDELEVNIEGAVDLYLEGRCGTFELEINGAGDINAKDMQCENVEIEINGAGDAEVYASLSIEATLNGIGDITVWGNPGSVRPRINGMGSFELK